MPKFPLRDFLCLWHLLVDIFSNFPLVISINVLSSFTIFVCIYVAISSIRVQNKQQDICKPVEKLLIRYRSSEIMLFSIFVMLLILTTLFQQTYTSEQNTVLYRFLWTILACLVPCLSRVVLAVNIVKSIKST